MTRKEWVEKNMPNRLSDESMGGVISCPYIDSYKTMPDSSRMKTEYCFGSGYDKCIKCWNTEMIPQTEEKEEEKEENMEEKEEKTTFEITKAEAESLCDFIDSYLFDAIRVDTNIDNLRWLINITDTFKRMAEFCEYDGLTYSVKKVSE